MKLARTQNRVLKPHIRITIDEAWRWPLAWPVTVGALIRRRDCDTSSFADSKALSPKKRSTCFALIQEQQQAWALFYWVWRERAQKIDEHGIITSLHNATVRAIFNALKQFYTQDRRAALLDSQEWEDILAVLTLDKIFRKRKITVKTIQSIINVTHSHFTLAALLLDWNHDFWLWQALSIPVKTIIKWDAKNVYIGMASIVAKVSRDNYMARIDKHFPEYWFEQHKWYWTKQHRAAIKKLGCSTLHRKTFCSWISTQSKHHVIPYAHQSTISKKTFPLVKTNYVSLKKPPLLLHICCAPDLSWPLHRLKHHFHLHLFWYNPNIHPRQEHTKRYESFLKLVWLETWEYTIIEDWYDPREFFQAMIDQKETIDPSLKTATKSEVLTQAWAMEERSSRCNPCYQVRLQQAAKAAERHNIRYFTSTLLISPKKHGDKLYNRWVEAQKNTTWTQFLWFDFAKNKWYEKASYLTKKHKLYRQNYCWCWRTVPKPWEDRSTYRWW